MAKLTAIKFRIQNYRNVEDSGWVDLDVVTALIGRNESGKSALLKALHKFNPASSNPYEGQIEFPRHRFTRDFGKQDWPIASIHFRIEEPLRDEIRAFLDEGQEPPREVIFTRHYSGALDHSLIPAVSDPVVSKEDLLKAVSTFQKSLRRVTSPTPEQEAEVATLKESLDSWATQTEASLQPIQDFRQPDGTKLLQTVISQASAKITTLTKPLIDTLLGKFEEQLALAKAPSRTKQIATLLQKSLPVFIYFENYGILDSAIYLPTFIEDLKRMPHDSKVRTIHTLFRHVDLDANEILALGREQTPPGQPITAPTIVQEEKQKHLRSVKLSSASQDISDRFSRWWHQRRHRFRYHADGNYFRIWVSDDRRRDEIEFESRSGGLQWFFSFYLVFLVESEDGHKDAILLLDEPGLHLHPTAQQELIEFFEELSKKNQIIYATHMPFLIDGSRLDRVRVAAEDEHGISRVATDIMPHDRDSIFPLQAALGYSIMQTLFLGAKHVLVEGITDYWYLQALSAILAEDGKTVLRGDIMVTPCGGTRQMGYLASLFLAQRGRPLVLLDSDDAGRAKYRELAKELYYSEESFLLLLDQVLGVSECEMEDVIGEALILNELSAILGQQITLSPQERKAGPLGRQIEAAAKRFGITLPERWKAVVGRRLIRSWAEKKPGDFPAELLDRAERLIQAINQRLV